MRRMRTVLLLVSLVAAVVTGVGTDTASARETRMSGTSTGTAIEALAARAREPNPPGCDPGAFCAYTRWPENGWGNLMLETQGNWFGLAGWASAVYNNGLPWPGLDHVQLGFGWPDGTIQEVCIHYNPGPGHLVKFAVPVVITRVQWRGEC
jgi:hypothetical protein